MRAAVVGGGIFGCTSAIELAQVGVEVDLYEARHSVLLGASRANQGRLHAGYHYPRSLSTAMECRDAIGDFARRFPSAVRPNGRHHYLVAANSQTSADDYLEFLDELGLPYRPVQHPLVRRDTVDLTLAVQQEAFVDLDVLGRLLRRELLDAGVNLRFNCPVTASKSLGYDWVVDATYGRQSTRPLRFELCEIALIRLGQQFADQSFVAMDGPYMSLDPLAGTDLHMLYDVHHSVHHVSDTPEVPPEYVNLVDQGPRRSGLTAVAWMEQTARHFLNGIGMPEYRGSLFTVRAVLPDVDDTDERPTLVERLDGNVITVFSGKIVTSVAAARRVVDMVRERVPA